MRTWQCYFMCHTYHKLLFSVSVHLSQKPKCLVQLKKNQKKSLTYQGETTVKFHNQVKKVQT